MARVKPEFNLAGVVPADHGLAVVKNALLEEPRQRRFAIIEFVSMHTGIDHPPDDGDIPAPILQIVSWEPITGTAEVDQLRTMRDRAKLARPGQHTLDESAADDDLAARRGGGRQ